MTARVTSRTFQLLVPAGEAPLTAPKDEGFTVIVHPEALGPTLVAAYESKRHEARLARDIVHVHHVQRDPSRARPHDSDPTEEAPTVSTEGKTKRNPS